MDATTKTTAAEQGRYFVKCDECRETMRYTDSVHESACGGRCEKCRASLAKDIDALQAAAARIARRNAKAGAR